MKVAVTVALQRYFMYYSLGVQRTRIVPIDSVEIDKDNLVCLSLDDSMYDKI